MVTLIKILVVVAILILLRDRLAFLRPHWPVLVGLSVGGIVGWWWGTFLINSGTHIELFEYLGYPQSLAKPLFAVIGALAVVKPISNAIRELFPRDQENNKDVR